MGVATVGAAIVASRRPVCRPIGALAAALSLFALAASPGAAGNAVHVTMTVDGTSVVDETGTGSSFAISRDYATNHIAGRLEGRAFQGGDVGAKASVFGTLAATAKVTSSSRAAYRLVPPGNVKFAGGTLVIYVALNGEILGTANMDLATEIDAVTIDWEAHGSGMRAVSDQPGNEAVQFDVPVVLPATVDPLATITVISSMVLNVVATTAASGQVQFSSADALNTGAVTGFRVLNAAGAQVTGFKLSGNDKVIPELAAPPAGQGLAIEYYNAAFEHYFVTASADEIGKLDSGTTAGWERTGESFRVFTVPGFGLAAVCRFFSTAFGDKSSHFYAPRGLGCEDALLNPAWTFEGEVFLMALPDGAGDCPAGTIPVYRLYNNGQGGAPNHRFTTSETTRLDMLRDGYVAEGKGIGVGMCAPAP